MRTSSTLPLFVYGTLRDREILAPLLGERIPAPQPAILFGYETRHYGAALYPGLRPQPGTQCAGLLLIRLTPKALRALDHYEGAEYRRAPIWVRTMDGPVRAQTYLPMRVLPRTARRWTLDDWQRRHKRRLGPSKRALARRAVKAAR